jgi:circadian clock protein KaiB
MTELIDNSELEAIDVYQHPILARNGRIVATPTLVKEFPRPIRRLIGNFASRIGPFVGMDAGKKGKGLP